MKKNVGIIDRVVRIMVAILIIGLYFTQIISGTLAIVLLVLSGVLILTTLIGFCPLYYLFGINTCIRSNQGGK